MNSGGSKITSGIGSPAYMSPEKIRGDDYGLPSDIWYFVHSSLIINSKILIDDSRSLGVIVHEMCTKELPFRGDDEIKFKSTPKLSKEFEDLNELFEE
jgi:serine/threonine protein kinase